MLTGRCRGAEPRDRQRRRANRKKGKLFHGSSILSKIGSQPTLGNIEPRAEPTLKRVFIEQSWWASRACGLSRAG
jgi:hypothetical protein